MDGLLYMTPQSANGKELDIKKLEELNRDSFLLTYEILSKAKVTALNANYDCTLITTNFSYNSILRFPVLGGGFFTKAAQEEGRNVAVLNLKAATSIFGNEDINGKDITVNKVKYLISGVVDDGIMDENRVYIPVKRDSSASSQTPSDSPDKQQPAEGTGAKDPGPISIMAMAGAENSEEFIKIECKTLGISEGGYYYAPIGKLAELLKRMPFNMLRILVLFIAIMIFAAFLRGFGARWERVRDELGSKYFSQALKGNPKVFLVFLVTLALMALSAVIGAYSLIVMIPDMLAWNDMREMLTFHYLADCGGLMEKIRGMAIITLIQGGVFVISGALMVGINLAGRRSN
jgi:hypothetical protein